MQLTQALDDRFEYKGHVLNVDMSFDNILRFFEMLDDNFFGEADKIVFGLEILLVNFEPVEDESFTEMQELFGFILLEFLGIDIKEGKEEKGNGDQPTKEKEYDFKVDAERIFASFLMDYNIDLFEKHGDLHWKKFIALLNGLSKETPFMKVVEIRTSEVPKSTKHNAKERNQMIDLKKKYSLLTDEEKLAQMDNQFDSVSRALKEAGD